ncbi:AaceriADR329Wp [[Ashbya] aceris (nom. inval.)]|nr:AaceriADR329Wp [[Ashbya] aceris (nom. inval.)]
MLSYQLDIITLYIAKISEKSDTPSEELILEEISINISLIDRLCQEGLRSMEEGSEQDSIAFRLYLASLGYIAEEGTELRMDHERRLKLKLNLPRNVRTQKKLIWKRSASGPLRLERLQVTERLKFSDSFNSNEVIARDKEFIDSIYEQGSAAEPVWGTNGDHISPAHTLLPDWERLKIQEEGITEGIFDFRHGCAFDNNLMCTSQNSVLFIALGYEFRAFDLTKVDLSADMKHQHRAFNLLDSYLLYSAIPLPDSGFLSQVPMDYRIHFIKACAFYGSEYVAMCCESGYIMMFLVDDFKTYDASYDINHFGRPIMQPRYILEASGSCWAFDIYDDDPNIKIIAAGHNAGSAPTGITIFAHYKDSTRFVMEEITTEHNVPCVNFIKNTLPGSDITLAYTCIYGSVGTIRIQPFLYMERDRDTDKIKIPWEYWDEQYFTSWCWTITPVARKDFHNTTAYEYLTNTYNQKRKEKELELIYQGSLLLDSFPSVPSHSAMLGIAAHMSQLFVPVSRLDLLNGYQCMDGIMEFYFVCADLLNGDGDIVPYRKARIKSNYMTYNDEDSCMYFVPRPELPPGDGKLDKGIQEADILHNGDFITTSSMVEKEYVDALLRVKINEPSSRSHQEPFYLSFEEQPALIKKHNTINLVRCLHGPEESLNNNLAGSAFYENSAVRRSRCREVTRSWMSDDPFWEQSTDAETSNDTDLLTQDTLTLASPPYEENSESYEDVFPLTGERSRTLCDDIVDASLTNHVQKLYRLYSTLRKDSRHKIEGPGFDSVVSQDYMFVVTTNTAVYLVRSDPLIINALTIDDLFPTKDVTTCQPAIEHLNRISIVCYISELSCIVVASQIGLLSVLRLTEFNGVYSFRQEYVIGWEYVPPEKRDTMCMSQYTAGLQDSSAISCGHCNTVFPYFLIQGLDYVYVPDDPGKGISEHALLYVVYRNHLARYSIYR